MLAVLTTASLVGVVYFAASSVSVVADVAAGNGPLGGLVACASKTLGPAPLGTAVGFEARELAAFDATQLVLCEQLDAGVTASHWELNTISHVAIDHAGQLYACVGHTPGSVTAVSRDGGTQALAPLACDDLVGTRGGVVVMEADGTLSNVERDGRLIATRAWPRSAGRTAGLSVNFDGSLLLLVHPPSVSVFRTVDLTPVVFATPCEVEHAGWSAAPNELRVKCASEDRGVLRLNVVTGSHELQAVDDARARTLVPGRALFIEPCGRWPCAAPPW